MLISTMNDLPGHDVTEVLGEVTGLTVRARNVGAQLGAGLKSIVGGELKGLTKQLMQSREEAIERRTRSSPCGSTPTRSARAIRRSWRTAQR